MKRYIKTSTCDGYWYHARHGVGPGTIPRDCHLLKVVEDPDNSRKDYFLLDRALTSAELKEFDLKEECPPQITASSAIQASKAFPNKWKQDKGDGYRFLMDYTDPDRLGTFQAHITMLKAYDDADYVWAYIDGLRVKFYDSKGLVDKMWLWSYEPDDYAGDVMGYVNDVFDAVCNELIQMNSTIKPVMVHN